MIKCPFCQTPHVLNTLFCTECGLYLLEGEELSTAPLDSEEISWKGGNISDAGPLEMLQIGSGPMTVRLEIGAQQREVQVVLNKIIHLGRLDPASNTFPEVDFTMDGIHAKGVSRRHADMFKQGVTVMVEDLGSINGTFINGNRLAPYMPEVIYDGDILQLSRLLIKVKIQR